MKHFVLGPDHELIEIQIWRKPTRAELAKGESTLGGLVIDKDQLLKWSEEVYGGGDGLGRGITKRRVAETTVGPYWVSTAFLGLDHNFFDKGPPLVFETMVFDTEQRDIRGAVEAMFGLETHGTASEEDEVGIQWRYSTWDDAIAGHARAVKCCVDHLGQISAEVEKLIEPQGPTAMKK